MCKHISLRISTPLIFFFSVTMTIEDDAINGSTSKIYIDASSPFLGNFGKSGGGKWSSNG
jgi:hypothetical protein